MYSDQNYYSWNHSTQRNFIVYSVLRDFREWQFVNFPWTLIQGYTKKPYFKPPIRIIATI